MTIDEALTIYREGSGDIVMSNKLTETTIVSERLLGALLVLAKGYVDTVDAVKSGQFEPRLAEIREKAAKWDETQRAWGMDAKRELTADTGVD